MEIWVKYANEIVTVNVIDKGQGLLKVQVAKLLLINDSDGQAKDLSSVKINQMKLAFIGGQISCNSMSGLSTNFQFSINAKLIPDDNRLVTQDNAVSDSSSQVNMTNSIISGPSSMSQSSVVSRQNFKSS